jgi:hypothetical protein
MKEYRCYFVNRRGSIGDVIEFLSAGDDTALDTARQHFDSQSNYPSYEIWEKARLVHREPADRSARHG